MFWHWLTRHTRNQNPNLSHLRFVIYSRSECSLCDKARHFLQGEQKHFQFSLESIDIDDHDDLKKQFGCQIPVIEVNGKVRFRGIINPVLFRRFLRAEGKKVIKLD